MLNIALSVPPPCLVLANPLVLTALFQPGLAMTSPLQTWLLLLVIALPSQALFCYILWRLLQRRRGNLIKTDVLHSVVHEFQTPIAAIRMAVDVLDSPIARNQPDRTDKYLRIIREETERLQHQVETMLTLARADRNTLIINVEPVSICSLLNAIAERHTDYLTLSLQTNVRLLADRLHLTNVLHNLVDNAVKYSVDPPRITLDATMKGNELTLTVSDQGIGIPAQHLKQIFQPFYRIHDRHKPSIKGFGLGLSYVQRIVMAHNWRIDVLSEPGKGSRFIIYVPAAAVLPPVNSAVSNSPGT